MFWQLPAKPHEWLLRGPEGVHAPWPLPNGDLDVAGRLVPKALVQELESFDVAAELVALAKPTLLVQSTTHTPSSNSATLREAAWKHTEMELVGEGRDGTFATLRSFERATQRTVAFMVRHLKPTL